jgi:hypothetical protein
MITGSSFSLWPGAANYRDGRELGVVRRFCIRGAALRLPGVEWESNGVLLRFYQKKPSAERSY